MSNDDYVLADDILRGAQAIARFIGKDVRETFYALERGHIPALKEGGVWTSTRSRLTRHYNETRHVPALKLNPEPPDPEPIALKRRPRGRMNGSAAS